MTTPQATILITFLAAITAGCNGCTNSDRARPDLKGTWEVVACERAGHNVLGSAGGRYEFDTNRYRYLRNAVAESPWVSYSLNVNAYPHQILSEVRFVDPGVVTRTETGITIYRISGDELLLCRSRQPGDPPPQMFATSTNSGYELLTLKRVRDSESKPGHETPGSEFQKLSKWQAEQNLDVITKRNSVEKSYSIDFSKFHFVPIWTPRVPMSDWNSLLTLHDISLLRLRACEGVGDLELDCVAQLTPIKTLDLRSTLISDLGLSKLSTLSHLTDLDLSLTNVTDAGVPAIRNLLSLRRVVLENSRVTQRGVAELRAGNPNLEVVWSRPLPETHRTLVAAFERLGFEVTVPSAAEKPPIWRIAIPYVRPYLAEAAAKQLNDLGEQLSISTMPMGSDDMLFEYIRGVAHIVEFNASEVGITDNGLQELRHHPELRVLRIQGAWLITSNGLAILADLPNLERVDLSNLKSNPDDFLSLLKLQHLKKLSARISQLPSELCKKFRAKGIELDLY